MNYQDLSDEAVINWIKELNAHNGRYTKRAHELRELCDHYSMLLRYEKKEQLTNQINKGGN